MTTLHGSSLFLRSTALLFHRWFHNCFQLVQLVLGEQWLPSTGLWFQRNPAHMSFLSHCFLLDVAPVLNKSAKASVAMMCISIVLVFLLCFGFSWRRRDGESEPAMLSWKSWKLLAFFHMKDLLEDYRLCATKSHFDPLDLYLKK